MRRWRARRLPQRARWQHKVIVVAQVREQRHSRALLRGKRARERRGATGSAWLHCGVPLRRACIGGSVAFHSAAVDRYVVRNLLKSFFVFFFQFATLLCCLR
jgi:hypothetical protein